MTKVRFFKLKYGNYLDRYYRDDYHTFVEELFNSGNEEEESKVNLGITDGIMITNTFRGDFTKFNCAVILRNDVYDFYRIVRKTFIRKDMWQLTMKKDIVSAEYNNIVNSDVLVSRLGLDTKVFDPLLFMDEGMNLSQVKKGQIPLTEVPGVESYGYLALFTRDTLSKRSIVWDPTSLDSVVPDEAINASIENWLVGKEDTFRNEFELVIDIQLSSRDIFYRLTIEGIDADAWAETNAFMKIERVGWHGGPFVDLTKNVFPKDINECYEDILEGIWEKVIKGKRTYYNNDGIYDYVGKTVKYVDEPETYELSLELDIQRPTILYDPEEIREVFAEHYSLTTFHFKEKYGYDVVMGRNKLKAKVLHEFGEEINVGAFPKMEDQPFEAFFIPIIKDDITIYIDNEATDYKFNEELVQGMLYDLISKYGGENATLIDVQLLPYSPNSIVYGGMGYYNKSKFTVNENLCKNKIIIGNNIILLYGVENSIFRTILSVENRTGNELLEINDYKEEQLMRYKITNPSGSENYIFDVSKNGGIDVIVIDTNIRPFASYFHLRPIYESMYGRNYKDTRGLIWQEDMSLTQTSSAWETYKRQNVNYMESFLANQNFEISHRDLVHETNRGNFKFDSSKRMIEATLEGAVHIAEGVAMGAVFGGPAGGIAGGIGAGAIMLGQAGMEGIEKGQMEYNIKKDLQSLDMSLSLRRKQFNYDIGNIKALPENVNKVSGIFSTNRLVPYIQISGPTDDELDYFNNYIRLNGCNVGIVVDLSKKEFNYLQGTILQYNSSLTMEEYEELEIQLSQGVRKMEGEIE